MIKTGAVFGDVEVGVNARITRTNADGGVAGRTLELVDVIDDGGDPQAAVAAVAELAESGAVFAVILATAVPTPEVTDALADASLPFFGWGFAPGFCVPGGWGFGFNGCLLGPVLGLDGAETDASERLVVEAAFGDDVTVALAVDDDVAGTAAAAVADQVWGDRLLGTVRVPTAADEPLDATVAALGRNEADVILLSVRLGRATELHPLLREAGVGPVVDTVSYLPGLLGDFATADALEGAYAISQFPPQEEYRDVTAVIADDLDAVDAPLVYSQAVSLGYWSSDLLVAVLEAVGQDLDTQTFHGMAVGEGVAYAPGPAGAPCPIDTSEIQSVPAGGAALVQVVGGIYRPEVAFDCYR